MKQVSKETFLKTEAWMQCHARGLDLAKWNFLFHDGTKETILSALLQYQNDDGGFGHGLEADLQSPLSAAIPSAEAILQAYEYGLDCTADWFQRLLRYFEMTVLNIPKYWPDCPPAVLDAPHAPWWRAELPTAFSPNPCAVVASAMLCYGTDSQKAFGARIAEDCWHFLQSDSFCGDHDTRNLMVLAEHSPSVSENVFFALKRRILENTCFDTAKWEQYYFQPLDFVSSPTSVWFDVVAHGVDRNLDYWVDTVNEAGVWTPNFSWGVDTEVSRRVTKQWTGYLAVNRMKILRNFGRLALYV